VLVGMQDVTPEPAMVNHRATSIAVRRVVRIVTVLGALLIASVLALMPSPVRAVSGSMIIAGNGPELQIIERLA
jgi:hypothetical protein